MKEDTPAQPLPSTETLMIDDLAARVARTSLEAAQWRARAIQAEGALEEIKEAALAEEQGEE